MTTERTVIVGHNPRDAENFWRMNPETFTGSCRVTDVQAITRFRGLAGVGKGTTVFVLDRAFSHYDVDKLRTELKRAHLRGAELAGQTTNDHYLNGDS